MQGNNLKHKQEKRDYGEGLALLSQPVLPLLHMVQFFFLTGSFQRVSDIISELPAPIETAHAEYPDPAALLHQYDDLLSELEMLNHDEPLNYLVIDEEGKPVDRLTAISSWVAQQILTRELERINSLLCAPCSCSLCCIGPDGEMQQEFFEIPLDSQETNRFDLPVIDSDASRRHRAMSEPVFMVNGQPFYRISKPALVHWQTGWSLIMPRGSSCPHLDESDGRCREYPNRPQVCRRPQIFPYLLERVPEYDQRQALGRQPAYRLRQSLLAIMDCPYVRDLKDEIATYAAAGELELILTYNKG